MRARLILCVLGLLVAAGSSWLLPRIAAPPDRATLAMRMLDGGRPGDAAFLFETPEWRGVAEHRNGRQLRAIMEFLKDEKPDALYNAGVAYAQLHEWGAARAAFRKALRLQPGHVDAIYNLAVVERAEAAESKLLEDSTDERAPGGWKTGEKTPELGGDEEEARTEQGGAEDGETKPTQKEASKGGQSEEPGQTGETALTGNAGGGPASGLADSDLPAPDGFAAPAAALRRESAQAVDILLRRIRDDPEKVLAARLRAAHDARLKWETPSCADC
ncbi:MAG: tetratricopeptide repeat protein [Paracoccaceae bacterium]